MSTLYNLEPQPTAKVILKTTSGDIVLELFAKQIPLASRNFLQHCLDGYYDNTVFHRLVPGFIIQGGDPTGLGTGGVSALDNGAPFEDEFHSRLRFNRRGLLGMANTGEPNDNGSQFFLTLDKTPELQGKNTMFGRVEGDTIYNLMKMGEADLAEEGGDRPLYPTKITGAEILVNPFEDMVKRIMVAHRTKEEETAKTTKKKRKAGKTLLSFGGDEGEDIAPVIKKAKVNPSFKTVPMEELGRSDNTDATKAPEQVPKKPTKTTRQRSLSGSNSPPPAGSVPKEVSAAPAPAISPSPSPEPAQSKLDHTNAQIAALKESMRRNVTNKSSAPEKKKSSLEAMIPTTATRGRKRGKNADERGALDLFNSFRKRLGDTATVQDPHAAAEKEPKDKVGVAAGDNGADDEEAALCDLHFIANCQSCKSWDEDAAKDEAEDDNDPNWMAHSLSFARDTLGKDLEWKKRMEDFEVIDPREKAREIVGEKKKGRAKGREWDKPRDPPNKIKT